MNVQCKERFSAKFDDGFMEIRKTDKTMNEINEYPQDTKVFRSYQFFKKLNGY